MNYVMLIASLVFGALCFHYGFRDSDPIGVLMGSYLMFSATEWRKG